MTCKATIVRASQSGALVRCIVFDVVEPEALAASQVHAHVGLYRFVMSAELQQLARILGGHAGIYKGS